MLVLVYSASNSTSSKATSDTIPMEKPSQAEGCLELYDTSSAYLRGPRLCGTIEAERTSTVALRTSGPRLIIRAVAPTGQHAPSFTARYTIFKTGTLLPVRRPDIWLKTKERLSNAFERH